MRNIGSNEMGITKPIYEPYSEINRVFEYKGRKYHRGNENSAFECGLFQMKLLDGSTRVLKPYHRYEDDSYSVDIFTTHDDCILMIETILKDQEYIEILENKIKLLIDSLRGLHSFSSVKENEK